MRFRRITIPTLFVGFLIAVNAQADCLLPAAPYGIPNGGDAKEQELIAAMHKLQQYNADVENYLQCLDGETKLNHISPSTQDRLHNQAVDSLQKVANRFNEQVRRYKLKNG